MARFPGLVRFDAMARDQRLELPAHGFLNLYKPVGMTSMAALRRVKHATGQRRKVGHAGTLDPLAEGVLPICFGQATRLMEDVVSSRKRYRMTMRLGAISSTYDAEGEIEEVKASPRFTREAIAGALVGFVGRIEQVPPMFSAIKVDGQRLYDLARSGQEVARTPRPVSVYEIHIDEIRDSLLRLTVDCGRGTYLRSLAHDVGQTLGCGAYVTELRRLRCGRFKAEDGVGLEELERVAATADWRVHLHPIDWALQDWPATRVTAEQEVAIKNGQPIRLIADAPECDRAARWRAYGPDGVFLALLEYQSEAGRWQPRRVFQGSETSPYAPPASETPAKMKATLA